MVEIEETAIKVVEGKPFVVVGVPAFNEERTIARVILESQKFAYKVVVCDDGSEDLTGTIAERLGADVVRHSRNLGYGAAVQSLFRRARELDADVLVTLDGDGQHDPSEIPSVLEPIVSGKADVVIGSRFVDKRLAYTMPWYRRGGVKFLTKLTNNGSNSRVKDTQSGFRAYSSKSLENLVVFEDGMGVSSEILMNARKQKLRVCEVSTSCQYDNHESVKTSTHNPLRHGASVVASIIRLIVEERPLSVLGIPGILCMAAGTFFGVWLLQLYAQTHQIVTNVALASIAFTLIGVFALFTSITLYAISRLGKRVNNK